MSTKNLEFNKVLLNITLVVMFTFPKLNLNFAGIPLYIIDFLLILNWLVVDRKNQKSLDKIIFTIFFSSIFFICISELFAFLTLNYSIEPFYSLIRTLLTYSLLILLFRRIQSEQEFYRAFIWVVRFSLVTVLLVVLSSIPQTRDFITKNVFELSFLDPAKGFLDKWDKADIDEVLRGRSLIGVSIITGYYLVFVYVLNMIVTKINRNSLSRITQKIFQYIIIIGVLFTNSRGPILTLILVILVDFLYLNSFRKISSIVISSVIIIGITFVFDLSDLELYFNRVIDGSEKLIDGNEGFGESENERLLAYIEPFEVIGRNLFLIFFGLGISERNIIDFQGRNLSDHAVFASAIYSYGLIFALLFISLLGYLIFKMINSSSVYRPNQVQFFVVIFIWQLLGHAIISETRGMNILMITIFIISADFFKTKSNILS